MSGEQDFFQEILLDHFRKPRHPGRLENPDIKKAGVNPLCDDRVELTVQLKDNRFEKLQTEASGCVISQASTSIMSEAVQKKSLEEANALGQKVRGWLMGSQPVNWEEENLDDLQALEGVRNHPSRVKCALLSWNLLLEGIKSHC